MISVSTRDEDKQGSADWGLSDIKSHPSWTQTVKHIIEEFSCDTFLVQMAVRIVLIVCQGGTPVCGCTSSSSRFRSHGFRTSSDGTTTPHSCVCRLTGCPARSNISGFVTVCFVAMIPLQKIFDWGGEKLGDYLGKDLKDLLVITLSKYVFTVP